MPQAVPLSKKRRYKRGFKLYRIKYGPRSPEHRAYARRLSPTGMFISTNFAIYAAGTPLSIAIEINGKTYDTSGTVRNARKGDARLMSVFKPGMGVEFTDVSPELKSVLSAAT